MVSEVTATACGSLVTILYSSINQEWRYPCLNHSIVCVLGCAWNSQTRSHGLRAHRLQSVTR